MRTRNSLTSSLTILLLVVTISRAQAAKVTVVNTSSNPVPVSITGTPTVNIGNLPEGTNLVQVTSSTNAPVIIRDADNARQPFRQWSLVPINDGEPFGSFSYAVVPTGKRLVVEFVSVSARIPTGQQLTSVELRTYNANGSLVNLHDLLFAKTYSNVNGKDAFVASQQVRVYFNPGETPQIALSRSSFSGFWDFTTSISGYYIDLPTQ